LSFKSLNIGQTGKSFFLADALFRKPPFARRIAAMKPDNSVVAFRADEARFSATFRVVIDMVDYARGQGKALPYLLLVQAAVEIDPFAAVRCPRLPAKGLRNASGAYGLFKFP
jgi:hypothetical protein